MLRCLWLQGRAGRRVVEGFVVEDWAEGIWDRAWGGSGWWLMPAVLRGGLDGLGLGAKDREILERRFGLDGQRPWGLEELGEELGTGGGALGGMHAGRMVQGALRRAEGQ